MSTIVYKWNYVISIFYLSWISFINYSMKTLLFDLIEINILDLNKQQILNHKINVATI